MNPIFLTSVVSLTALGFIFGTILAIASKKFAVEVDPRIEEITDILPGTNCGSCGYPGCASYAEAIVTNNESICLCSPGGQDAMEAIADLLGVEAGEMVPQVAVVRCGGSKDKAKSKYIYQGIQDCNVAELIGGGSKACEYGCLGLGSCVEACPYDAIEMQENGLPKVIEEKCTGCALCVDACPRGIMEMIPRNQKVYVACVSQERGKKVKAVCEVGCTGCTLCANPKFTPSGKVKMEKNLPVIPADWEDFETSVKKCPTQCFMVREVEDDENEE